MLSGKFQYHTSREPEEIYINKKYCVIVHKSNKHASGCFFHHNSLGHACCHALGLECVHEIHIMCHCGLRWHSWAETLEAEPTYVTQEICLFYLRTHVIMRRFRLNITTTTRPWRSSVRYATYSVVGWLFAGNANRVCWWGTTHAKMINE